MKKIFILLLFTGSFCTLKAQLKQTPHCDEFNVDILDGRVNGVRPDQTMAEIKSKLPCFTSSDPEGSATSKCGGTVFYRDKDVYFYTDRDYVEIGEKFKGKMSIPLMGAARTSLFKWLGHPQIKDVNWDAFETAYGILVLHYNAAGKTNLIQMTTKSTETLNLCQ